MLNDTEKRKQYDLYGPLEDQQSSMRRHSHRGNRHDFSRGFEGKILKLKFFFSRSFLFIKKSYIIAEVSAEELFNMFFGGSFGGPNVYVRRGRQWERQRTENTNQVNLEIQIFLINTLKHFILNLNRDRLELVYFYSLCPF